jgi:hypothetical protein
MKSKIIGTSIVALVMISACLLMTSPVLAGDPPNTNDPPVTPILTPYQQYEALQHGQTGSSATVTTTDKMSITDYATSLMIGVTPENAFAEQMREEALQLLNSK